MSEQTSSPQRVMKFGGASLADAGRIRHAVGIVLRAALQSRPVVVVSALHGVTDELLELSHRAAERDDAWRETLSAIRQRHAGLVEELAAPGDRDALRRTLDQLFADLEDLLHGVHLLRECSPRTRDAVLSIGERAAAPLVAAAVRAAGARARDVDARPLVITDADFGRARVDMEETTRRIRHELEKATEIAVVTGFLGATPKGETTTLGRSGSDYTASLVAAALRAEALELWKDVDGVLSADPRLVADAFPLPELSYAELMELSHFGAKVIHPPSLHPARQQGVPLRIRNVNRPDSPGTVVLERATPSLHPVRGITSIPRVTLMRLEGDGMVGVPGVAMRLFGALARHRVSVILISQASSEHSICFAVAPDDSDAARAAVSEEFALERRVGLVDELVVDQECSVLAVVGEGMREQPGLAGRLFGVLGARGVNVRAIAQGSSELNLSLVIGRSDQRRAVGAVHDAFFAPDRSEAAVAVLGTGNVGGMLLRLIQDLATRPASPVRLRLVAVANGHHMALDVSGTGIALADWRQQLADGAPTDLDRVAEAIVDARGGGPRVLVDCTASASTARILPNLLRAGVSVVAANKIPFSGTLASFDALRSAARHGDASLRYEATVGAGLPVLSTLVSLVASGDRVLRIEGVLSGTLNFLAERLRAGDRFSAAVRQAHESGYTEPNPWDDLSGEDVRRKLCILARTAGLAVEPGDIEVVPPVPGTGWERLGVEALLARLAEHDDEIEAARVAADALGQRLRFVAALEPAAREGATGAGLSARLRPVGPDHPCFELRGADNLIAFTTERYFTSPLVVRGPGAGPEVTAAGVLADLIETARAAGPSPARQASHEVAGAAKETP
jgi:bifunctional aspartokinase / homoserine dehydrogenase 1